MMTLEDRARHAAQAVHEATVAYRPRIGLTDLAWRRTRRRLAAAALVGVAVVVLAVAGTRLATSGRVDASTPSVPTVPEMKDRPDLEQQGPPDQEADPRPTVAPSRDGEGPIALPPATSAPPVTDAPPATEPPVLTSPPSTAVRDTTPPRLVIVSPEDGSRFTDPRVRIEGLTEPGAKVTVRRSDAVAADKAETVVATGEGKWSIAVVLAQGTNRFVVTATDASGNHTSLRLTLYYAPKISVTDGSITVVFSAHAAYGSSGEDPPYDVYFGTAQPGTKVTVSSEFGSGDVAAGPDGAWKVEVFFPEAPLESPFKVEVRDQFGHAATFEFVRHASG